MISPDRYVAALDFAATRHHGQKLPGTELPYVIHPVSVAAEVMAALESTTVADPELAVVCALLHDTIEDTGTSYDEVAGAFGRAVADGVLALSKDSAVAKPQQMADCLRRIQLQPPEIWIVKLADRTDNLSAPPPYWPIEKRRAYRDEAIVIADALGAASPALDARLRARITAYAQYF